MQISELFQDAKEIKKLVSERSEKIKELEKSSEALNEKIKNSDRKERAKLKEELKEIQEEIAEQAELIEKHKVELTKTLDELMEYRVVKEIFEKQVKNEIEEKLQDYSAVNNVYKELIKETIDDLDIKYKDVDIDIESLNEEYNEYFKDIDSTIKDLEAGKMSDHKDLCDFLDKNVNDEVGGYLEKYKYLKESYNEKINLYNYRTYNKTIDSRTEDRYTKKDKEEALEKYNLTIEQLIENQMPAIEKIAQDLNDNLNLKRGIEEHFKIYTLEDKELLSKDTLEAKTNLIKNIILSYAKKDIREDMGKREDVLKRAVKNVEERIKELQKEYGDSKEEKEIKEDNNEKNKEGQNIDNLKSKTQNAEKKTYTVTISQDELSKILQMREKQKKEKEEKTIDKEKENNKETKVKIEDEKDRENKEIKAKSFFNSIKERIIKQHNAKEIEKEDNEKSKKEDKEKVQEEKNEPNIKETKEEKGYKEYKELNENEKRNFNKDPEYYEKLIVDLMGEDIEKAAKEEIEEIQKGKSKDKEELDKDEIER